ncbi:response regulator, partial [Poseidonibacter ostreae]
MNNNFNILLIDNIKETLPFLQDLRYHQNNINIHTAATTEEGLNIMFRDTIDLIITDIDIPLINGFELIEFLPKNEKTKKIPFLFFTTNNNLKDELKAYEMGAMDYIQKTISSEILVIKLNRHINMIKKEKNQLSSLLKLQETIIKQFRTATIGEIVTSHIIKWKESLDIILLTNSSLRFKTATNQFTVDSFEKKLSKIDDHIYTTSSNIKYINNFFVCEEKKSNLMLDIVIQKALHVLKPLIDFQKVEIITHYKVHKEINKYTNDILQILIYIIKNSLTAFEKKDIFNPKITITVKEESNAQIIIVHDNIIIEEKETILTFELYTLKILLDRNNGTIDIKNTEAGTYFYIKIK